MKLGPVTKLDKRNKTTSKKIDNVVMPENWNNLEQCGSRIPDA